MKVACIGCGMMGSALMRAVCRAVSSENLTVCDTDNTKAAAFAQENSCKWVKTDADTLGILDQKPDFVFLAVKPGLVPDVLANIASKIQSSASLAGYKPVFVSMAAGVTIDSMQKKLGHSAFVIRIMPNLPATVSMGMTGLSAGANVPAKTIEQTVEMLSFAGKVEVVAEKLMDGVGAVSGSGPAYGFMFIEALADAAVKFGIPRKQALVYAAQTLKGAAEMVLQTGVHPAELKDQVCSPAGTTIEGVRVLEKAGFRSAVIEAASAVCQKSIELGKA